MEGTFKDVALKLNDGKFDEARAKILPLHQAAIDELRQNTLGELDKIETAIKVWLKKCNADYDGCRAMGDYGGQLDNLMQRARHVK